MRVEFVGGRFLYAVEVDTSLGFELGPADVCEVGDASLSGRRRYDPRPYGAGRSSAALYIVRDFRQPIVSKFEVFLTENGIGIAGIEFIIDSAGELYTYDVNTNTNYNSTTKAEAGIYGMRAIAHTEGKSYG